VVNEVEVWTRARANDGRAFTALFDTHRDRVFRHVLRLVDNVHDAEEITSASFLELWRRRANVVLVSDSVLPWLLVAVGHIARNVSPGTRRYRALFDSLPRADDAADAEQIAFDPVFSAAVRNELDARVSAPASTIPFWRRHLRLGAVIFAGASILIGGAAAAAGLLNMPGAQEVTELGASVVKTGAGTATVQLRPVPDGATDVFVSLTCLTSRTFTFDDGASIGCTMDDVGQATGGGSYTLTLSPGQQSVTITTAPKSSWTIAATYVSERTTEWATNANGETYGALNQGGEPDLIAVIATNGNKGFVHAEELAQADGSEQAATFTSPEQALTWQESMVGKTVSVPVYENDGETLIGEFTIQY
jgi:hypothetical protein